MKPEDSDPKPGPREIVFVSPLPPPAGGIATWTRTLMARGLPGGFHPSVVDTSTRGRAHVFVRGGLGGEIRRAFRVWRDFGRSLRHARPTLVHANVDALAPGFLRDALCVLWARLSGIPTVLHYRGLVSRLAEEPRWSPRRAVVSWAARRVSANLALNESCASFLRTLVGDEAAVLQVPNFYDDSAVPDRVPTSRGDAGLRVIFVAGLTQAKGVLEVIDTARRYPSVDFVLLGREYPETEAALAARTTNVSVRGEVAHDQVIAEMASSHVLLFPTKHGEGFPNAVCEAMALGLAVVATPVGAIPEMIDHAEGGFLIPPETDAIADAIGRLESDDGLRTRMGSHNREKARRLYAYPRVAERLTGIYEGLLDR